MRDHARPAARSVTAVVVVASVWAWAPGCAALAGLDELEVVQPDASGAGGHDASGAGGQDAGAAGTAAGAAGADASTEAGAGGGSGSDASAPETGADVASDATGSAGSAADGPEDVEGGVVECAPSQKLCGTQCVSKQDPATGCDAPGCDPCLLPHADPMCNILGGCVISACESGFKDCDQSVSNGCEANVLANPAHCGQCGLQCPGLMGVPVCNNGVCGVSSCQPGTGDCDDDPTNGCETPTSSSIPHCGFCDNPCSPPYAVPACLNGTCSVQACVPGHGDCNSQELDGCEVNLLLSVLHCGQCDNACPAPPNALASCSQGECILAACTPGFLNCNGNLADGCERAVLSDPAHCGKCDHSCLGGTCVQGACMPVALATGLIQPWSLAVHGGFVWWTARSSLTGSVQRVSTAGGSVFTAAAAQDDPDDLALNSTHVFWTTSGSRQIHSVPQAGGATASLYTLTGIPAGIAVTSSYVVWTDLGSDEVARGSVSGSMAPFVLSGPGTLDPIRLVTDGTNLFWTDAAAVRRVPISGGTAVTIAGNQASPRGIALDSTHVYWANQGDGMVWRAPLTGGFASPIAAGQDAPSSIALDSTHAYWVNTTGAMAIRRVPKSGGVIETLAQGQSDPWSIAVDSVAVYWTNRGLSSTKAGSVMRLAK